MSCSVEVVREIWGEHNECVEIGPDRDGLEMVEIRTRESDRTISKRISFSPEEARLVASAMLSCANDVEVNTKKESEKNSFTPTA